MNLFQVLLVICLVKCSLETAGKHLLRFLTFCQRDVLGDGQYDIEYDGDQLLYVDPVTYQVVERLPEFAQQWTPDPGLARDTYLSVGTCHYNIPRYTKAESDPPVLASPTSMIYPKQEIELGVPNTLICFVNNFHPPDIQITWTKNGQLDFTPQQGDIYSCSVDHISLRMPLNKFWGMSVSHPGCHVVNGHQPGGRRPKQRRSNWSSHPNEGRG